MGLISRRHPKLGSHSEQLLEKPAPGLARWWGVSFFSGLSAARTPSPSEWLGVCMQGGWRQVLALNGFQGAHVYWPAELSPLRQAQLPGQGSVTEEEKSKTGQPTLEPGKGIACHWPGCLLGLWMKERGHPPLAGVPTGPFLEWPLMAHVAPSFLTQIPGGPAVWQQCEASSRRGLSFQPSLQKVQLHCLQHSDQ